MVTPITWAVKAHLPVVHISLHTIEKQISLTGTTYPTKKVEEPDDESYHSSTGTLHATCNRMNDDQ